jgi:hypothetical protein
MKTRHGIQNLGAVGLAATSQAADMGPFTQAILHITVSGALTAIMQTSPDDGATWFTYVSGVTVSPSGAGSFSYNLPIIPKYFRLLNVGAGNITACYIEGIREVA